MTGAPFGRQVAAEGCSEACPCENTHAADTMVQALTTEHDAPYADCAVVEKFSICASYRAQAQLSTGPEDADGNFSTVSAQDFLERHFAGM